MGAYCGSCLPRHGSTCRISRTLALLPPSLYPKSVPMAIYTLTLNPGLDRTLTVPSLHDNAVLRATNSRLDWGGKGFNVSRALKAMGEESVALGIVGGFTGQMLTKGL